MDRVMSKRLRASMRAANRGRNLRPRTSQVPPEPGATTSAPIDEPILADSEEAGHDGGAPQTPGPAGHDGGDPQTPGPAGHDGGDPADQPEEQVVAGDPAE